MVSISETSNYADLATYLRLQFLQYKAFAVLWVDIFSELRRIFEFRQFHNISRKNIQVEENISSKRLRMKIRNEYFLRYVRIQPIAQRCVLLVFFPVDLLKVS